MNCATGSSPRVYQGYEIHKTQGTSIPALRLQFAAINQPAVWFRVFVVRLGYTYTDRCDECAELLHYLSRSRYHLWMIRANQIRYTAPADRAGVIFTESLTPNVEAELQAALFIWRRRGQYSKEAWENGKPYLLERIKATYLGNLLKQVRAALGRDQESAADALEDRSRDLAQRIDT